MKAYSMDLRLKIIETYQNETISQKQLARRFRVSQSFITKEWELNKLSNPNITKRDSLSDKEKGVFDWNC